MKNLIFIILVLLSMFSQAQTKLLVNSIASDSVGSAEYITTIISNGKLYCNLLASGFVKSGYNTPFPPAAVPDSLTWIHTSGGMHQVSAVDNLGRVWLAGGVDGGIAGNGTTAGASTWTMVQTDSLGAPFTGIVYTQMTGQAVFAIKANGDLFAWGNLAGYLRGNGVSAGTWTRPVKIAIPGNRKVVKIQVNVIVEALCNDGTVWTWGGTSSQILGTNVSDITTPHQVLLPQPAKDIAGGNIWSYALGKDGTLYGWGWLQNVFFGSYTGSTILPVALNSYMGFTQPVSSIYTSSIASYFIMADSTLQAVGDNSTGALGNGQELDYSQTSLSWFLWPNPAAAGNAELLINRPVQVGNGLKFVKVYTGNADVFFMFARDAAGQLYFAGRDKVDMSGRGVVPCDLILGALAAAKPDSWDCPWLTQVNPVASQFIFTTSPYCLVGNNQGTAPCTCQVTKSRPRAAAGSPISIQYPASSVHLSASGSSDSAGTIISYAWSQVSGPNSAVISIPSMINPSITGLLPGTYTFKLKITDNNQQSDSSTVQVNVVKANIPPLAVIAPFGPISLPADTISLDGSNSYDPDGMVTSYAWSLVSGPCGVVINNANAAKTFATIQQPGLYVFSLIVVDNDGAKFTGLISVTVKPPRAIIKTVIQTFYNDSTIATQTIQ